MPDFERLKNPPIKEAVLWIRTNPVAEPNADIPTLVPDAINDKYPGHRQQITLQMNFHRTDEESMPESDTQQSVMAELRDSEDGSRTVSIRRDGISISALRREYHSWERFLDEFRLNWTHYLEFNSPETVNRISTRFINEIAVPFGVSSTLDLDDWIVNLPKPPDGLPDRLSRFTQQVAIPVDDKTRVLINLLSTGTSEDSRSFSFILDIDVAKDVNSETQLDDFWTDFDQLRELKNLAFYGTLTEKALDLYR